MRDKEKKHRKGQETTIGKIIYGFLLFMPLIAIGVTCGYAIFNKNAYQSWSISNEKENIDSLNFEYGQTYYFANNQTTDLFTEGNKTIYLTSFSNFLANGYTTENLSNINSSGVNRLYFNNNGSTNAYVQLSVGTTTITTINLKNNVCSFEFQVSSVIGTNENLIDSFIYTENPVQYSKIDNVFYYSVDKVTESPLFNWAQNSIIYTTTNATCNALSITAPFIPLLMSYWLIISVIYFLYDIALMLVWLIHRKIHELQESL